MNRGKGRELRSPVINHDILWKMAYTLVRLFTGCILIVISISKMHNGGILTSIKRPEVLDNNEFRIVVIRCTSRSGFTVEKLTAAGP